GEPAGDRGRARRRGRCRGGGRAPGGRAAGPAGGVAARDVRLLRPARAAGGCPRAPLAAIIREM
ncbi:MAG: hypothetical protein AVDCRST_MAG06-62, partial [uncultured Nocardioides sp.]